MEAREAYLLVKQKLQRAGVENAGFDADALFSHVVGASRLRVDKVDDAQWARLLALAERRAKREPLQYLLGSWPFLELELAVGPGVLIPRQETEELCLAAIACLREEGKTTAPVVWDLCAGSGALALGLQAACPNAQVTAAEWEDAALVYLRRNVACFAKDHVRAPQVLQLDVLRDLPEAPVGGVDLIVCNPPYVTAAEYAGLAPELYFEPRQALVPPGGPENVSAGQQGVEAGKTPEPDDGLLFYRMLVPACKAVLAPGGWLLFEIGSAQGDVVRALFEEDGYICVCVKKDMAGSERMVCGKNR